MTPAIYFALVVTTQPYVSEIYKTKEPCDLRVQQLKDSYTMAVCMPTTTDHAKDANLQLRALATILN